MNTMSTKQTIQSYFGTLKQKKQWETFLAGEMTFTNFAAPVEHVTGKSAYLESTKQFFSIMADVEVREIIIEGQKACVLSHYELKLPTGVGFGSDVAEILTVNDDKITSLQIYFDTAPFPK
jgi:ketosteroid isomerase-like protein